MKSSLSSALPWQMILCLEHAAILGHSHTMKKNTANSLDHLVLPVSSLEIARKRLSALGFSVAADGHHPFGSANACVFFHDDSYFEPLAVGNAEVYTREADAGNRFLQRDRLYRTRNGDDGFSLIAFTSADAAKDKAAFEHLGFDCGRMVSFRRKVEKADGSSGEIAVNLFITVAEHAPDLALFSCQWLTPKGFDRRLMAHANSALGIGRIVLSGEVSDETMKYLHGVTGQDRVKRNDRGTSLVLPNVTVSLLNRYGFLKEYGLQVEDRGLRARVVDIIVADLNAVRMVFFASGIVSEEIGKKLVVHPAKGQGYTLAFMEEDQS